MSKRPPLLSIVALALVAILALVGCSSRSDGLLSELRFSSQTVAASGKGDTPPVSIDYSLSRAAVVSAYLTSVSGEKLYIEKDESRPVAGDYSIRFNGSYSPDPSKDERRVMPAGSYQVIVEAKDAGGAQQKSTSQLQVTDSDTLFPSVETLAVLPGTLSANFDGIDDVARITYRTVKKATVSLMLVDLSGKRYVLEREEKQLPGEHSTTWDGQIGGQLMPSGNYRVIVESKDDAGNVAIKDTPLQIDSASQPEAHILSVNFDPQKVLVGGLVKVEIRVKNTGNTVLRTQGPDPGYTYSSQEGFTTIQNGAFRDQKGLWRVGVDWAGGPGASGAKYPYRWGFGKDLQPGDEATVVGYIKIDHKYDRIWLYAGLVQEQVRYWDNEVAQTIIEIGY